jgi:16S rRNA (uracil1498-N3)-methyltransferase
VTPPLFLLDPLPEGDAIVIDGAEGRHAATVMRIRVGETVLAGDGQGSVLEGTVVAIRPRGLELAISVRRTEPRADPRVVVVQALPKGDRGELAVELLTELGVDEIVPWRAARCVTVWTGARGDRAVAKWRRTAREAAKQSRRAWVPTVSEPTDTEGVAARLTSASSALVLHQQATNRFGDFTPSTSGIVIVVPEGESPTVSWPTTAPRLYASGSPSCAPRPLGRPRLPLLRPGSGAGISVDRDSHAHLRGQRASGK